MNILTRFTLTALTFAAFPLGCATTGEPPETPEFPGLRAPDAVIHISGMA